MHIPRSIGAMAAATAGSVAAVELGVALEVVKHVGTVAGAVVAIVSVGKLVRDAWLAQRAAAFERIGIIVTEKIDEKLNLLACVRSRGLICDKDGDEDSSVVSRIGGE